LSKRGRVRKCTCRSPRATHTETPTVQQQDQAHTAAKTQRGIKSTEGVEAESQRHLGATPKSPASSQGDCQLKLTMFSFHEQNKTHLNTKSMSSLLRPSSTLSKSPVGRNVISQFASLYYPGCSNAPTMEPSCSEGNSKKQ
jgi:hypothetical protein